MFEDYDAKFKIIAKCVEDKLGQLLGCHDLDHTFRVIKNSKLICQNEPSADVTVVHYAALLHDIARPEEMQQNGKICHAILGGNIAKEILLEHGFEENFAEQVKCCIRSHRYRADIPPETIEAKILYDADKLDAIGACGIGRAFIFAANVNAKMHNTKEVALNSKEYSCEDTAYREYLVKLSKLAKHMQTKTAYSIAVERIKFMDDFFNQLNKECF